MNYRKAYLQQLLISYGDAPHPRATIPQLENAVRIKLVQITGATTGLEVPSNLLEQLLPAFMTRGVKLEEIKKVATGMLSLSDPSTGAAGGTIATTASTAENETAIDNIQDVVGGIISLDIGETVSELGDLFGDFFGGGGLW